MGRMVRKQVCLEPEQEERLRRYAARQGRPESEIVRRGIDLALAEQSDLRPDAEAWAAELAFIERRGHVPAMPGQRTWSREDAYSDIGA